MSFHLGGSTWKVLPKLFAMNRGRLVTELKKIAPSGSVVVLQGGRDEMRYNTDAKDLPFRQVCNNAVSRSSSGVFIFENRAFDLKLSHFSSQSF